MGASSSNTYLSTYDSTDLNTGHVVTTLTNLIDVAHLPDQDLCRILGVTAWHRDDGVIEDGFPDDAHFVPVQLPHQLIVDHAGVDTSLQCDWSILSFCVLIC